MRWLFSEYILKGIFLGLLLFVALQEPDWPATGRVALYTLGGLAVALAIAAWHKLREGYRVAGKVPAFILFLLLESPGLVYAGTLLGLSFAAFSVSRPGSANVLATTFAGGGVVGMVFWLLRHLQNRWYRLGLSLLLAAGLVVAALFWFNHPGGYEPKVPDERTRIGILLLLGIPVFYLLTFAGMAEESEVEVGAMCAALCVAVYTLAWERKQIHSPTFLIILMLYFFYTTRVLPGLRVLKHVMRGISYSNIGRYRPALLAFRRALQLDPNNTLARESLWSMHRGMDLAEVVKDPETMALVDYDFCLDRATFLLLEPGPTPARLKEANHLLDLIENQQPDKRPIVSYWRAVAHTHAHHFEQAATQLERVLESANYNPGDRQRDMVLFPAWQLAVTLHPEMNRRVGIPQLAVPGRRLEAIAAVERQLVANAEDSGAWELKRLLYSNLTEKDYQAFAGTDGIAPNFDHDYCQQLGLALVADPARWQRGVEYLRLAARGLPAQAPSLYIQIAQAYEKAGNSEGLWRYYEMAKRAGRAVGPKNLTDESRQAYFATVKLLAENARSNGDIDAAAENYQLYSEYERSGLETLRVLADLYEKKGDVFAAVLTTEKALVYSAQDKDLLTRKDRYYYSVMPEDLAARLDVVRGWFDVAYCLNKARSLLDMRAPDLDLIDWAQHLIALARTVNPDALTAKVLLARALRRRGEIDQTQAILEDVYYHKPEKFASGEDDDSWHLGARMLGEMYLNDLGKPDLAIPCFNDFRKSSKSGGDTWFKLGQAYEAIGDRVNAVKCFKHVTAYGNHPLAPDAREALYRLETG